MRILTSSQMRKVDEWTTEKLGIPQRQLMENAAGRVLDILKARYGPVQTRKIAILCGKGSNGGDGLALGRLLAGDGAHPRIYLFAAPEELKDLARLQWDLLGEEVRGGVTLVRSVEEWRAAEAAIRQSDCIVDALLGTGIRHQLEGVLLAAVESVNRMNLPVVSVDLPSGLFSDDIAATPPCIHADVTVTFTAPKLGMVLSRNCSAVGEMVVAPIGTPPELVEEAGSPLRWADDCLAEPFRRPRDRFAHKGDFGKVLLVAGSRGKIGAALLAGRAALRSGAGMVTLAVPAQVQDAVMAAATAELMTEGLPDAGCGVLAAEAAERVLRLAESCDVLGVGPGLGTAPETVRAVREIIQHSPVPVVADADALNSIAASSRPWRTSGDLILTPHLGEMSRLVKKTPQEVFDNRIEIGVALARERSCEVVLKGFRSLTISPAGDVWVNSTGNPGMATAGSGDVLTGMISAFAAARRRHAAMRLHDVVAAAVYLHGLAGDVAARRLGEESLLAGDIIECLPAAFRPETGL